jgi:hypothetical protein
MNNLWCETDKIRAINFIINTAISLLTIHRKDLGTTAVTFQQENWNRTGYFQSPTIDTIHIQNKFDTTIDAILIVPPNLTTRFR